MKSQKLCVGIAILWVVTVALIGWFFVKGWTAQSTDGRTEILLAPSERDLILTEMRDLLKAVSGVVQGVGDSLREKPVLQPARPGCRWRRM
jgi:hypothetical protein